MTSNNSENKIKMILYGVRSNREWVEQNINAKYEIIAYTDSDPDYNNLIEFDYKPFISIEKLKHSKFDYILILPKNKTDIKDIRNKLISCQIDKHKIVALGDFETYYRNPIKEFYNLNTEFQGFVFGMSHSFSGFLTHYFDVKFFKFSSPSMDLYFHLKVLENIRSSALLNKSCYFVFELPYYIFNYDMSRCRNVCKLRMNYLEMFNDYHNYGVDEEEKTNIKHYKLIKDMFIRDKEYGWSCNNFENKYKTSCSAVEKERIYLNNDHVWYKIQEDTIHENLLLWQKIIQTIKKININAKIAVVVYPYNPYAIECHSSAIYKMKELFYQLIQKNINERIFLYDYYTRGKEDEFIDHCHMNGEACIKFSRFLNKEFETKFY